MTKMNIYASKDTFVCTDPNSKSLNFGNQLNLVLKSSNKALLYFDLSSLPANSIITSAKLQMFLYRFFPVHIHNTDVTSITIKQLTTDFYENAVTANTKLASTSLLSPDIALKNIVPKNINTVITFDNLTSTVKSWYVTGSTNHGFELSTSSTSTSTLSFFARENSYQDLQPKLEIQYTIANDLTYGQLDYIFLNSFFIFT